MKQTSTRRACPVSQGSERTCGGAACYHAAPVSCRRWGGARRIGGIAMPASNLPAIRACRPAWNRGRLVGQKRPLLPKHVWAIRVGLELADRTRDLALFNLAIDSKLRGCDLVRLRVADVYAAGQMKERVSITRSKARQPVRFEVTEGTRKSLLAWLDDPLLVGSEYLWPGRFHERLHISTRQHARLVRGWVTSIGPEPAPTAATRCAEPGGTDPPQDRQPPRRSAPAWPYEDG